MLLRVALFFSLFVTALWSFTPSGFQEQKILEPEEAFKVSLIDKNGTAAVKIEMAKGIYLYKESLSLKTLSDPPRELEIKLPEPTLLHDDEVYKNSLIIPLFGLKAGDRVEIKFQGCSQAGLCYPPITKTLTIKGGEVKKSASAKNEEEKIADVLKKESFLAIAATFFGFGLLLALTPCVFPMIPILSSIIVGTKNITTKKAFLYSLVYVLAMSLTYTVAGVFAGLFGANIQAAFQNPWIIAIFASVFVALAFSMFGFYEIGLPSSIQTALAKKSDEAGSKGGIVGVAIMGFLSALIVGPCVAPPLAGALIYIGQTGDALLGAVALFAMSMGMGVPLLLIGTGAGKFMPRPGPWMNAVSRVFGVVMLAVAIWLLERVVPAQIALLMWSALFLGSAVYLRSFENIGEDAHWFVYLKKSLGLLLAVYSVFLLFGAFSGAKSPLDPLSSLKREPLYAPRSEAEKVTVESWDQLKSILQKNDLVMVDFYADWCVSCKELEEITFADPAVKERLRRFYFVKADVTKNSAQNRDLMKRFGIYGPPAILFFKKGEELKEFRVVGYKSPKEFLSILDRVEERL